MTIMAARHIRAARRIRVARHTPARRGQWGILGRRPGCIPVRRLARWHILVRRLVQWCIPVRYPARWEARIPVPYQVRWRVRIPAGAPSSAIAAA